LSDVLDGALARRLDSITRMGSILDPCADFMLLFGLSLHLFSEGLVSPLFVALLAASFLQFIAWRPKPGADPLGKHIGTVLFVSLGGAVVYPAPWVVGWSTLLAAGYIVASLSARWLMVPHSYEK